MRDAARSTVPTLAILVVILAVGAWLRSRGIGHLLMWDEAFDACSVRAIASGIKDHYASHFWYHPPAFKVLMFAASPLRDGFAERSEVLALVASLFSAAALYFLNRPLFGTKLALVSAATFALLPGAVFYDTWIKGGNLAQLFGILSLLFFARRRYLLCGLMLGLGMLDKETATFYGMGIGLLWLCDRNLRRSWRIPFAIGGVAFLACAWWFLVFSTSVKFFFTFASGTGANADDWTMPWYYYFVRAASDLGPVALALGVAGIAASVRAMREAPPPDRDPLRLWPLFVLVPVYAVISAIPGKIPWIVNCLFAAWATLAAIGFAWVLSAVQTPRLKPLVAVALLALMGWTALSRNHEQEQKNLALDFWPSANRSRGLAERLNKDVAPGERTLVTTFHYLGTKYIKFPCPVFTYYSKDIPVVMRRYDLPAENAINAIRENQLDWALLSPEPGEQARKLVRPLLKIPGVKVDALDGAYWLRTTAVYTNQASGS